MSWSSLGVIAGVVVGVPAALAVGYVFRGYTTEKTLAMLEQSVRVRDQRIADLEALDEQRVEALDASAARNMALDVRNHELLDMVTGRPELAELRANLERYMLELRRDHRRILERQAEIGDAVHWSARWRSRDEEEASEDTPSS